jgi:hypothetical protein
VLAAGLGVMLGACGTAVGPVEVAPPAPAAPGVLPPGGVAQQPMDPTAVPPVLQVANGVGPSGPYRAWVYRTGDGSHCFELAVSTGSGSGCGPRPEDVAGFSYTYPSDNSPASAMGGTLHRAATSAVGTLTTGATMPIRLVRPGAFLPAEMQLFVVVLPPGAGLTRVDVLDAGGTVLETFRVD